jgi:hypothetical protein
MSLDVLLQYCLLLAAVVAAFAISTGVGMLVARLWAAPDPTDRPSPRPSRSDPIT